MSKNNNIEDYSRWKAISVGRLFATFLCLLFASLLTCHPAMGGDVTSEITMVDKITPAPLKPPRADHLVPLMPEAPPVVQARLPHRLPSVSAIILGQDGHAYAEIVDAGNLYAVPIGSAQLNSIIREKGRSDGHAVRKNELGEINDSLREYAESRGVKKQVWNRVAKIDGGIEVDLGDENHRRVRITAGRVEIIERGSQVLFYRPAIAEPMVSPAETGDLGLLNKYLNLYPNSQKLLLGWLGYTMSTPKLPTSQYVLLQLIGQNGAGKSSLARKVQHVLDPNRLGLQILPSNAKDIAIAGRNSHVVCYDNVRSIDRKMADILCVTATGGVLSSRQLYSDAGQSVIHLHGAIVLTTLHNITDQPDLAQRCLPIELIPIVEKQRKTEAELSREFQSDLPAIMRGLFDLIAEVFKHLPDAEIENPERMLEFVRFLAAMEKADGVPTGVYQTEYSDALNRGQRDSLTDNILAAAVLEYAEENIAGLWSGTPAELMFELNSVASKGTQRSRDWPPNSNILSKRLRSLQAGLLTQGIQVEFGRGKYRNITIKIIEV